MGSYTFSQRTNSTKSGLRKGQVSIFYFFLFFNLLSIFREYFEREFPVSQINKKAISFRNIHYVGVNPSLPKVFTVFIKLGEDKTF